jgi:UDP-glucose 4-epimerase
MKVGVTGGAGFIGGWVCDVLVARGHEPLVLDHRGRGDGAVMLGDIRDATAVMELASHVDGIIHLAAVLGTQETVSHPRPAAETNVIGGLNVLEACRAYRLPLVNICVGNWWMRNTYSTTKHCVERFVEQFRDELGCRFINVRVVNAYGPRQAAAPPFAPGKVRKIMPAFICRALSGMPVEVYGDGEQVSDCVWVGDVAHVLVTALESAERDQVPAAAVEVGPVFHHTVNELAEMVNEIAGGVGVTHLSMRPGEQPGAQVMADLTTLRPLGIVYGDFVPLEVGITDTVDWFSANEGVTWRRP